MPCSDDVEHSLISDETNDENSGFEGENAEQNNEKKKTAKKNSEQFINNQKEKTNIFLKIFFFGLIYSAHHQYIRLRKT